MKLLKAIEVAEILRVSRARVYELARTSALPSIKLGERQIRFCEAAIQQWIAKGGSVGVAHNQQQS